MEVVLEVVKITLPSFVVFFTAYFLVKKMLDSQESKIKLETRKQNSKEITALRLQAYERLILLMERMEPSSLVLRLHNNKWNVKEFQSELVANVRKEFDHNLSQQMYVSNIAWSLVKQTKEETIKIINIATAKLKPESKAIDLSRFIIEMTSELAKLPNHVAIDYLKKEARKMF